MKSSRWTMVMVGVTAFLVLATMVWTSPLASAPSAQRPPYDAQNADMVDSHHAAYSGATKRANRVLWANKQGQLHWRAMPQGVLNRRYLNDDRKEIISAAVTDGAVLSVANTAPGSGMTGLGASSADGRAVWGDSGTGCGVVGSSKSGKGVLAVSESGGPLSVWGYSGSNLIEAWDEGADPDNLRFKVTRAGDIHTDGLLTVGQYASVPTTCDEAHDGAIALTSGYRLCVCKNGTGWVYTSDGTTSCTW